MRFVYVFALVAVCTVSQAQKISLDARQQQAMRDLVASDTKARARYLSVKKEADKALSVAPKPSRIVRSAGLLVGDPLKIEGQASFNDIKKMQALSFAYVVSRDEKYGAKLRDFVKQWAAVNEPPTDAVDGNHYENLLIAYDLVRPAMAQEERVDAWFRLFAQRQREGKGTSLAPNNKESQRLKTVGMIGFMLGDQGLIDYAVAGYKTQIARGIEPDGATYDFRERDALYYHLNDIKPLLTLARVADQNGVDLYVYHSGGVSLGKAIDFVLPYVEGKKTHAEFANSRIAFDKKRAANGEANFQVGRKFDPASAVATLEAASYFRPELDKVIAAVTKDSNKAYPDPLGLWIAASRLGRP